ncbi:MAG: GDP-mannose 4,6-dehydratase [Pseudomonadota bacterium]
MTNWLITGGAGFIGSHLAEALLRRDDSVYVLDDLSTGSARNVEHLRPNPRFHFYVDTVNNLPLLAELVDYVDVVVHLAAAVGVKLIVDSPVRTIETNINGTEHVLRTAEKKRKRVLVASTSEVYGKSPHIPFREDGDLVLGPSNKGRWSYAASKLIDEFLAIAYWKERRLPTTVVRLFNTVGPRQTGQYGMVLPTFARQALKNQPITVYGTGNQTRCFCHVSDVVRALIELSQRDAAVGEVYNVGSTNEITIMELAQRIRAAAGSESIIQVIPYEEAYEEGFEDMLRRVPDITKIGALIGWKPDLSLDQIIHDVLQFERQSL